MNLKLIRDLAETGGLLLLAYVAGLLGLWLLEILLWPVILPLITRNI